MSVDLSLVLKTKKGGGGATVVNEERLSIHVRADGLISVHPNFVVNLELL